ncbi:MAG TPA: N-acetylmuramoyl-L-alanine amidase [Cyanobacteria bacterium UBA11372]|nr:N-acetylmuramoyl-L-alanine amidase [Cyanobacteria bacterium UBA11372]
MQKLLGLVTIATAIAAPALAAQPLYLAYPPNNHRTTSDRIFFIGTAPPSGRVLVNGRTIQRSPAGHFAPTFPLRMGDNVFTFRYRNQQRRIKVTRLSTQPSLPVGLAFGKDSLTPRLDIARMPGEAICFSAIAPANATVNVKLANQTIPLTAQPARAILPPNSAALVGQNLPNSITTQNLRRSSKYQGCATADSPAELGRPEFQLTINGKTIAEIGQGNIKILSPTQLEIAEVIVDGGIARTGPSTDHSRLTPLPKGTQASITGTEGDWVRLDYGGWINKQEVRISQTSVPPRSIIRSITTRRVAGATEVVFPLQVPVPVSVQQSDRILTLTLHNTTAQTDIIRTDDDPIISRLDWQQVAPDRVQYTFNLKSQQQWGYKLRYDGTSLVLTLRYPPPGAGKMPTPQEKPLSGIKILLDPGHGGRESGAAGPTGYLEKDVNLTVAKLIRDELVARGATVIMTREDDRTLSLPERVAIIDRVEPAIALSIHYNSLPDNGDAFNTKGIGMFWYHPQAHSLAMFLHDRLVGKLNRPSYGVFWNNLALARPASAPSVLLELGFMSNPFEFEWLMNPTEQRKLAGAIASAIAEWFSTVN